MTDKNGDDSDQTQQDEDKTEIEVEVKTDQEEQQDQETETTESKQENEQEDKTDQDEQELSPEEKCEEYKEKWLRAQADYRNLKKSMAEKKDKMREETEFKVLEQFITVFDNLQKAYRHKPESDDEDLQEWQSWAQGMEYILKQFEDILDDYGVKQIESENAEFDPNLHTAAVEKHSEEVDEGMIMEVMEEGYKTDEKVLKPAKVAVSKGPETKSSENDSDQ
ncbi:MAG: nucleotide exchange factor GrpE [Candidatus Magasanikbacteria bacterium]